MRSKKLLRKFHITTIYVTHDQQEAVFMGDRLVVMRDGIIEQVGTFDELYYAPNNLFVASFIGSAAMNLLPVEVAIDNSNHIIRLHNSILPLNKKWRQSVAQLKTSELILGIQPQVIVDLLNNLHE